MTTETTATPEVAPEKRALPRIDPELHRRLKMKAAEEGRTLSALLEELGWAYLGEGTSA
jgi:predicted HicB family RNase H-like nuclease